MMMNVDKRILDELRRECLEIEREGAPDFEGIPELDAETRELFDSVIAFATDDDVREIDAFFAAAEGDAAEPSASKDRQIKQTIKQFCARESHRLLASRRSAFQPSVAYRSSQKGDDEKTRKAIEAFAKELFEEEDTE